MGKRFRGWSIEQRWLLPPSVQASRKIARGCIVEPVNGHIKEARCFRRFSMRGAPSARGEWSLLCTVHNLLKLAARRI